MGLLNRAQAWLAEQMPTAATPSGAVVYTRLAGGSVTLTGLSWVGNTAFRRQSNEAGAAVVWGDRDYLIPVSALGETPPARGDRITEMIDGTEVVFEVGTVLAGEPDWRYSDPQRTVYRVHCVEVG